VKAEKEPTVLLAETVFSDSLQYSADDKV
jgi:hypothetical protein